jgi:predicted Rdx family selenoprotein
METGSRGVFDILVDGQLLVSRSQTKRIPDEASILELVRGH